MARTPMIERDLYEIVRKRAAQAEQKEWEYAYKLLLADTDEEDIWLFGKPMRVAWPDGLPLHFKSADEMHAWAREKLAELRREPPDLDRKA